MDVAFREKTEKFTPAGVMFAPRGRGRPGLQGHGFNFLDLFDNIGISLLSCYLGSGHWSLVSKSELKCLKLKTSIPQSLNS